VSAIRAIIFDLGKVLVDFDHSVAARKIAILSGKTPSEIYNSLFDSSLIRSFEEGKISPEAFFIGVQQRVEIDISFEQFCLIWNNIFFLTKENEAVYDMLKVLREHYILAMLSNINVLHYSFLKATIPVFGRFHHLFASCEMGVVKPDKQIYRMALSSMGVGPQEAIYTDDRPEMVAAARSLGIQAFVYKDISQLKKDLISCGVSIGA
jgi:glucose-1-phosphatase